MKIITAAKEYAVAALPSLGEQTVRIPLEAVPPAIGDTVTLTDNEGAELCPLWEVADWMRCFMDGNTLVMTQIPEPETVEPTDEELAAEIRARRDALLKESDKYALLDAPIDETTRQAVYAYRQALRDVPEQAGFPRAVLWPEVPAVIKADPDPVDLAFDALIGGGDHA